MYGKECRWLRECWWCVQIAQTVLSGSKGLMLFQTYHEAISRTNMSLVRNTIHAMRTVSEAIRTGDIGGVGFTVSSKLNEEVMVETILSPTQLLVTVINIDAKGYSNLLCHGKCSSFLCIRFRSLKKKLSAQLAWRSTGSGPSTRSAPSRWICAARRSCARSRTGGRSWAMSCARRRRCASRGAGER